jgi:hypothetical protein
MPYIPQLIFFLLLLLLKKYKTKSKKCRIDKKYKWLFPKETFFALTCDTHRQPKKIKRQN